MHLQTTIRIYELLGAEVYLYFDLEGFDCTARVNARTTARPGDEVSYGNGSYKTSHL